MYKDFKNGTDTEPLKKVPEFNEYGRYWSEKNDIQNTGSYSFEDELNPQEWYDDSYAMDSSGENELQVSVFDVAAYILKQKGAMSTMKLQKLVYYCQAWSLVWDEKPLFKEQIEAWANGPVVKELFSYHRGMFQISSVSIGNPDLLDADQRDTINAVLDYYGDKPAQWLIDLTHMEKPWQKAREGLPVSVRSNKVIDLEDIAEYYSSLPPDS